MPFRAIIYTIKILSENFMFKRDAPFVPDPILNRKKSEFIPDPLLSRELDREFIPMWVKDITGEVHEQCDKVSTRQKSGEYCERNTNITT